MVGERRINSLFSNEGSSAELVSFLCSQALLCGTEFGENGTRAPRGLCGGEKIAHAEKASLYTASACLSVCEL